MVPNLSASLITNNLYGNRSWKIIISQSLIYTLRLAILLDCEQVIYGHGFLFLIRHRE